jgi:hypothetical protein
LPAAGITGEILFFASQLPCPGIQCHDAPEPGPSGRNKNSAKVIIEFFEALIEPLTADGVLLSPALVLAK